MTKTNGRKATATVTPHPMAAFDRAYEGVWRGIVETPKGRVYSCLWRRDEAPTADEVLDVWATDRKAFRAGY